jgi:hypothetical protein
MMRSSSHQSIIERNLLRDGIGILLSLAIGIGGMIFVFSIPDPFATLATQVPLLTPRHWQGSHAGIGLGISTEGSWREQRGFSTELEFSSDTYFAGISQIAFWYADPMQAAALWNRLDRTFYKEEPFVTSAGGDGKPSSMLFCGSGAMGLSEGFRECWYLVYWGHWFTEVQYASTLDENLHALEMQKIAALVDQLIRFAPREPCYGILCTGTK